MDNLMYLDTNTNNKWCDDMEYVKNALILEQRRSDRMRFKDKLDMSLRSAYTISAFPLGA